MNYSFSGHETFHCRGFWLKKGFDFASKNGAEFNDSAVMELGVGRNMVGSIRYWLRAFSILDDKDELTEIATNILSDKGWDPYLEDEGTLWLLHFLLVNSKSRASAYNIIFGELRRYKQEFTKKHYKNIALEKDPSANLNTLDKDFSVFVRTYLAKPSKDKEESYSGLLSELGLLRDIGRKDEIGNSFYRIENNRQTKIPKEIILYCILSDGLTGKSISIDSLFENPESLGNAFAFTRENLEVKLMEIANAYKDVVYKNDAGIKELQFKGKQMDANMILTEYYG